MRCVECGTYYGPDEVPIICADCRPGKRPPPNGDIFERP